MAKVAPRTAGHAVRPMRIQHCLNCIPSKHRSVGDCSFWKSRSPASELKIGDCCRNVLAQTSASHVQPCQYKAHPDTLRYCIFTVRSFRPGSCSGSTATVLWHFSQARSCDRRGTGNTCSYYTSAAHSENLASFAHGCSGHWRGRALHVLQLQLCACR